MLSSKDPSADSPPSQTSFSSVRAHKTPRSIRRKLPIKNIDVALDFIAKGLNNIDVAARVDHNANTIAQIRAGTYGNMVHRQKTRARQIRKGVGGESVVCPRTPRTKAPAITADLPEIAEMCVLEKESPTLAATFDHLVHAHRMLVAIAADAHLKKP